MRHNNSTIFFEEDKMLPINYNTRIDQQHAPLPTLPDILSRKHFNHTSKPSASSQLLTSTPEFVNFADFNSRDQQIRMPNFMQLKPQFDINDDRIVKQFNKKTKKNNPVYKNNQYQKSSKDYKILKQVQYGDVSINKQKVTTKTKKKPTLIILDQQLNNKTSMHESHQQPIISEKPVKNPTAKLSVLEQYFERQRLKNAVIAKVKSNTQNNFSINIQLNRNKKQSLILPPPNIIQSYAKKCESTFYILQNYSDYESSSEQDQQQLITRNEQSMQEQPIINQTVVSNKPIHLNINDSARRDRLINIINKMKSMVQPTASFI